MTFPGYHPLPGAHHLPPSHSVRWLSPQVIEQQPSMFAASLVGGTLVGSAWTHGLLQVGWGALLDDAVPRPVRQSAREGRLVARETNPRVA